MESTPGSKVVTRVLFSTPLLDFAESEVVLGRGDGEEAPAVVKCSAWHCRIFEALVACRAEAAAKLASAQNQPEVWVFFLGLGGGVVPAVLANRHEQGELFPAMNGANDRGLLRMAALDNDPRAFDAAHAFGLCASTQKVDLNLLLGDALAFLSDRRSGTEAKPPCDVLLVDLFTRGHRASFAGGQPTLHKEHGTGDDRIWLSSVLDFASALGAYSAARNEDSTPLYVAVNCPDTVAAEILADALRSAHDATLAPKFTHVRALQQRSVATGAGPVHRAERQRGLASASAVDSEENAVVLALVARRVEDALDFNCTARAVEAEARVLF
jgi:hypothetical protein